jgi:hypothetical protein
MQDPSRAITKVDPPNFPGVVPGHSQASTQSRERKGLQTARPKVGPEPQGEELGMPKQEESRENTIEDE